MPEEILGNSMSFLGRNLLQSESLNLVQSRETTQYRRWRLRKSCCYNVDESIKKIFYMKFWLTVSTNGVSTRLCHKRNNFYLFWFKFGCACLWLAEKVLQKWRWFFSVVATRLFCQTMFTITTRQHDCRFLVLQRIIENVAAGFALFTVVETSPFFVEK